jgi:LacI family transcriptional regulator
MSGSKKAHNLAQSNGEGVKRHVATIKDVARLAGVGLGTASRVVTGRGSVSAKTLARVNKAIEQLDFRPSHAARSLLSGTTQMIGVYIPVLKGTFYTPILQAINTELRTAGLHMVVEFGVNADVGVKTDAESGVGNGVTVGNERKQAMDGIEFLIERGCDGLIVMSNAPSEQDIAALGPKQSQIVVLNHDLKLIPEQCFAVNHKQGGVLAARALLEHKHRHIAAITGPSTAPDNVERMKGFIDELGADGIDTAKMWIAESDFSPEGGWSSAEALVASGHKFTALFCANDEMAVGALSYFQKAGISVPNDVSVIGYDDTPSADFCAPRLTSVHVPWREITVNAINALLNRCYGSDRPVKRDFAISVTYRDSLAKASATRRTK